MPTTIAETLHEGRGIRTVYTAEGILCEIRTAHQHLVLFKHPMLGKVLVLDGAVQLTTRDAFIYHEMMTHVPLFAHGQARHVLIVGGGDCGIAAEVIKHKAVKSLTQVEIDASVLEFAREYFPEFTVPVFADPRFESVIADGAQYVANTKRRFDVIIVDSTDPQGPGEVLFTREFYAACRRCLNPNGILVTQNGVPFLQPDELVSSVGHFRSLFRYGGCYVAAIPTYVGGHMAMGWASDRPLARRLVYRIRRAYERAGLFETRYWTPEVGCASLNLPRFIADLIK